MKHTLFYVLLLIALPAWSQEPIETAFFDFGSFEEDDKLAFVFADVANARKSPDVNAAIVSRLPIGTEVRILEITRKMYAANGLERPWIRIKAGDVTGYVPAQSLTNARVTLSDGRFVLWGLIEKRKVMRKAEYSDEEYEQQVLFASVRIADAEGMLQLKNDFEVTYADQPERGYLSVYPAPLIEGAQNLIVFQTPSEACGVFASAHYLLYGNGSLSFVGSGYSMGDGGVLHTSKDYVFPFPEYQKELNLSYHYTPNEGHILCIENNGEYDEECFWVETYKVADFTWNGEALEKACDY